MSDPITKQRSKWIERELSIPIPDGMGHHFTRRVSDGQLRVLVAEESIGWHLSISFIDNKGRPSRYPRWDEITDARDTFLPAELGFVMHLPPASEYVALHDTTFHLHQHPASGE